MSQKRSYLTASTDKTPRRFRQGESEWGYFWWKLLLTPYHHDNNTVNLFVGGVGRDVAKADGGQRGEREVE